MKERKLYSLFNEFIESEKSGGIILIIATVISLIISNSGLSNSYAHFWQIDIAGHSLNHWINDGLMAIFFLLIGLELEREVYTGELSKIRNASLPIFGALGGMIVPAGIFISLNYGTLSQSGAGIPMATDIAFAIGILSLLGKRVPLPLKIFLTALAVIDDLGAIIIIAIFYSKSISIIYLSSALGLFVIMLLMNRFKINKLFPYLILGVVMWYLMLNSGVHATISGVLLAFAIPFAGGTENSPSYKLQHFLHKPVAFIILPIFALANTALPLNGSIVDSLSNISSVGIILGLTIGKPLGIFLFSFIGVILGLCKLPRDIKWSNIFGAGILGGIGFTMSIFITMLAFENIELINNSKIAILVASLISAFIGLIFLRLNLKMVNVKV